MAEADFQGADLREAGFKMAYMPAPISRRRTIGMLTCERLTCMMLSYERPISRLQSSPTPTGAS